jgi:hypothetical protein
MEWIEIRHTAKKWFEEGRNRDASHLIINYSTSECRYYPVFVFPDQDVEFEVIKSLYPGGSDNGDLMVGVLSLLDDMDVQINTVLRPMGLVVSRVEN